MPICAILNLCNMSLMTIARKYLIDREKGGFHHIVTRCVRRTWLCGKDARSGRDYSYRKKWIEQYALELSEAFTVNVFAYAAMSNHYHLALEYRPQDALKLSDSEVARRWLIAFPPRKDKREAKYQALLKSPELIAKRRGQLADLSWFMKCLNQRIAVRANREDDCTGKFWEGRFHSSKPLKTLQDVYACMTYIDLNPVNAGASPEVASPGEHTSLRRRVEEAERDESKRGRVLAPMLVQGRSGEISSGGATPLELTLRGYLEHVHWTARAAKVEAKSRPRPPPSLEEPDEWLSTIQSFVRRWGRKPGLGDTLLAGHAATEIVVDGACTKA